MRYNKIRKMDISNGPGIRVSVFMQGCAFHCEGCFNPETWDFDKGEEFNNETIEKIIKLCDNPNIKGLSILGGEPLHPKNIKGSTELAKKFKEAFPEKNLWVWSGFPFEKIKKKDIFKYIDVLVDGQFNIKLFNPKLKYCGSSNQRIIDVQKSIEKGKIIPFYENTEANI